MKRMLISISLCLGVFLISDAARADCRNDSAIQGAKNCGNNVLDFLIGAINNCKIWNQRIESWCCSNNEKQMQTITNYKCMGDAGEYYCNLVQYLTFADKSCRLDKPKPIQGEIELDY